MNGDVQAYNLNKPMAWDTFLLMPDDLKREYLNLLVIRYNATIRSLSALFKVSEYIVRSRLEQLGLNELVKKGRKMSKSQLERWLSWLNGTDPVKEEEPVALVVTDPIGKKPETVVTRSPFIHSETVCMTGYADDIAEFIKSRIGDRQARITVSWEFAK